MLFSAETPRKIPLWRLVCEGIKTQTRRPQKVDDTPFFDMRSENPDRILWVTSGKRLRYRVDQDYAVQPKRGQAAVRFAVNPYAIIYHYPTIVPADAWWLPYSSIARIQITKIRSEDVREISQADAIAEGFESRLEFWQAWTKFYLPAAYKVISRPDKDWEAYDYLSILDSKYFWAWVLTFELRTAD